ncbi:MAG TPA: M55 family metallopeptidase [Armatimonadota bacterium]|nr:M55 family metallopeptidase [Armatimonadota bacterium]
MKILIMCDMEGVAGILNHDDWVLRGGQFYERGLRLATEEVNAAVDGFFAGGATEVLVVDGHGHGGINPEMLDERAQLYRCGREARHPWMLDDAFAGLAFVGQHAKAGTPNSHLTHTQWFDHLDMTVNGVSIGEYGQEALCAMELGVPTIFAAGEQALCAEAEALTPGVITVAVKRGVSPDGLDDLDADAYRAAKLGAIHLAPPRARALIRAGAKKAVEKLKAVPQAFRYPFLQRPYTRIVRLRAHGDCPAYTARDIHPDSLIALMNMRYTKVEE